MSTSIEVKKVCVYCGASFMAKTTVTRYCSHLCNSRHYKQRKREEKLKQVPVKNQLARLTVPDVAFGRLAEKEFLSIQEAATLIGISERTLYRLLKSGGLRATKIGRRTIIARSAIDQLFTLENHE